MAVAAAQAVAQTDAARSACRGAAGGPVPGRAQDGGEQQRPDRAEGRDAGAEPGERHPASRRAWSRSSRRCRAGRPR